MNRHRAIETRFVGARPLPGHRSCGARTLHAELRLCNFLRDTYGQKLPARAADRLRLLANMNLATDAATRHLKASVDRPKQRSLSALTGTRNAVIKLNSFGWVLSVHAWR